MSNVAFASVVATFSEALVTLGKCSNLFLDAEERQRIYFDDQIVSTALEIISTLTAKAAKLNRAEQDALLLHWIKDGPSMCQEIITTVERRNPPVLHRADLTTKFVKP
jgi:hypothetical protein